MREVMLYAMYLGTEAFPGERRFHTVLKGRGPLDVGKAFEDEAEARALGQDVERTPEVVDLRVSVDGDVIDIAERESGVGKAPFHRLSGQTRPVLDAAEAFLFSGGDELAVFDESGGGVAMVGVETEDDHKGVRHAAAIGRE